MVQMVLDLPVTSALLAIALLKPSVPRAMLVRLTGLEPLRVGIVGQPEVQKLVTGRGGAGGESWRDDENVVPELDAPNHCGGDPRGDLENELVDTKTVCHKVRQVLAANVLVPQAAARRGGSGVLVARHGRRRRAGRVSATDGLVRNLLRDAEVRAVGELLRCCSAAYLASLLGLWVLAVRVRPAAGGLRGGGMRRTGAAVVVVAVRRLVVSWRAI